jgi:hypothetical protein
MYECNVFYCIADEHIMYTSLYGHRLVRYNTMPHLYSYPVTVLLYGEILLLGMDCGKLYNVLNVMYALPIFYY